MAKTMGPCLCSTYAVRVVLDDGAEERQITGCEVQTTSKFGPGHDAKLKSLLIKAGVDGNSVIKTAEGAEHVLSALDAASEFGFAAIVSKGIDKARERAEARERREADKLAKAEARRATPGPAQAKVGRKIVDGVVLDDGQTFEYTVTTGAGDEATTEVKTTTRFKVVAAPAVAV